MLTRAELYQLYHGDDLTTTQIGERCGVTATTIQNWLRAFSIKSKPRHPIAQPIAERFSKSYRVDDNGCWIWTKGYAGGKNGRYGMLRLPDGSSITGHRLSYALHHGEIPQGMLVCHRCDVPACVNPAHLFLGTFKDNNDDKISKGRANLPTKISVEIVEEIRASSESPAVLARKHGINRGHAWRIRTGKARRAQMQLR